MNNLKLLKLACKNFIAIIDDFDDPAVSEEDYNKLHNFVEYFEKADKSDKGVCITRHGESLADVKRY